MNHETDNEFFKALTNEVVGKSPTSALVGKKHAPTTGDATEARLRNQLRKVLPGSVEVGKGFVRSNNEQSPQIDILLYSADSSKLAQEDELVFLTPDAVRGIIEVKTTLTSSNAAAHFRKLASTAALIRANTIARPFFGLFAANVRRITAPQVAAALQQAVDQTDERIIHTVCLSRDGFVQYHEFDPDDKNAPLYAWRSYALPGVAPAAFIAEIVRSVSPPVGPFRGTPNFPAPPFGPKTGEFRFVSKRWSAS